MPAGPIQRVELFEQFPDKVDLAGLVGVMKRSATEDVRSLAWPVVSEVLRGSEAPTPLAAKVLDLLDAWVNDDAPRLDADDDGFNDHAGPTIKDFCTLLGKDVDRKYNLSYCGNGSLEACRDSLWQVVDAVTQELAMERGDDPGTWLKEGARTGFTPGLISATFRSTNRPTFQQVLEFAP